jgi:hypothetical protein
VGGEVPNLVIAGREFMVAQVGNWLLLAATVSESVRQSAGIHHCKFSIRTGETRVEGSMALKILWEQSGLNHYHPVKFKAASHFWSEDEK